MTAPPIRTTGDEIQAVAQRLLTLAERLNQGVRVPVTDYNRALRAIRAWRDQPSLRNHDDDRLSR
jgi:hypothetical protein